MNKLVTLARLQILTDPHSPYLPNGRMGVTFRQLHTLNEAGVTCSEQGTGGPQILCPPECGSVGSVQESQGQRSLVGFRLWGCTESDTTETN